MSIAAALARDTRMVDWMGTRYAITVGKSDSAGLIGVFEGIVPAGDGPPLHIHHNEDEVLHVVEGAYEFWLDGRIVCGGPGFSIFLPRGVAHTFRIVGDRPGRNLGIVTPGGFENFFVEAATHDLQIPQHMPELVALAGRYSLEFLGPAPWGAMR